MALPLAAPRVCETPLTAIELKAVLPCVARLFAIMPSEKPEIE